MTTGSFVRERERWPQECDMYQLMPAYPIGPAEPAGHACLIKYSFTIYQTLIWHFRVGGCFTFLSLSLSLSLSPPPPPNLYIYIY